MGNLAGHAVRRLLGGHDHQLLLHRGAVAAVAGLLGIGLALAWQHRQRAWSWLALGAAVLATAGYATWLLPASGTGLPGWLRPAAIGLAAMAVCCVAAAAWRRRAVAVAAVALTLATAATLIVPAAASAAVVQSGLGPFQTPFEPFRESADITAFLSAGFEIQDRWSRWSTPTRRIRT